MQKPFLIQDNSRPPPHSENCSCQDISSIESCRHRTHGNDTGVDIPEICCRSRNSSHNNLMVKKEAVRRLSVRHTPLKSTTSTLNFCSARVTPSVSHSSTSIEKLTMSAAQLRSEFDSLGIVELAVGQGTVYTCEQGRVKVEKQGYMMTCVYQTQVGRNSR